MLPIRIGLSLLLILPAKTGFLMLPMKIRFLDIASEILPMRIGLSLLLMLPAKTRLLMLSMKIGFFDITSKNWAFDK